MLHPEEQRQLAERGLQPSVHRNPPVPLLRAPASRISNQGLFWPRSFDVGNDAEARETRVD